MALLDAVRKALRITHNALDEAEILPLIAAAKSELAIAGVTMLDETDAMIARAITVYVKAHFGYDNPEADRFERVFASIKGELSLLEAYTTPGGGGIAEPTRELDYNDIINKPDFEGTEWAGSLNHEDLRLVGADDVIDGGGF